jgi:hypothetical protein
VLDSRATASTPNVSRRTVLLGVAALTVSACTDPTAGAPSPVPSSPTPDELLRRELVAADADLVTLYAATRAAHPELADVLAEVEQRHRRHGAAVGSSGTVALAPRAGDHSASPAPSPAATTVAVDADPVAALRALRSAEESAASARLRDCLRCEDSALAELVAAIAAGEAANRVLVPTGR